MTPFEQGKKERQDQIHKLLIDLNGETDAFKDRLALESRRNTEDMVVIENAILALSTQRKELENQLQYQKGHRAVIEAALSSKL